LPLIILLGGERKAEKMSRLVERFAGSAEKLRSMDRNRRWRPRFFREEKTAGELPIQGSSAEAWGFSREWSTHSPARARLKL
jgi:hypothetical protein